MPLIFTVDTFNYQSQPYTISYNYSTNSFDISPADLLNDTIITTTDRGRVNDEYITAQTFGSDVVEFRASLSYPFATANINTDTGGGTGTGGGSSCDIAISTISTSNQNTAGASDGSITISATSSNAPIQYSIDNATWQNSNIFTGLPGGSGTAYVQDAANCTAQQAYNIATTPVVVNRLISTPATAQSRWSALFNPIVFGYQSAVHAPGRKFITQITYGYNGADKVITATHAANLTGYCRADISKYLRVLLQPIDEQDYTTINYRDANASASYTVQYKEAWDGGQDTDWTSAGDPFYITYSAMQIGNPTGGNMSPFVTQPDANQTNPAKFLNDFITPILYTDMPWDIAFIYSEKVAGLQLKLGGNGIDINGNICGQLGELMLLNEDGSVLINEDGSRLLIEQQAPGVLLSQLGINRLRIDKNIPAQSIWLDVFIYYTDDSGNNIPVTEQRRLLLDNSPCNGLPYEYLKWMGPSGGWLYYMLIKNQFHELATNNAILMDRYIDDYATADSTQQLISISAQKKITAGKNDVPANEAETLATLLYSPKVYRLVNAQTNTWQGVIIDTKSLKMYQTYGNTGDFEISYLLPEVNVQRA